MGVHRVDELATRKQPVPGPLPPPQPVIDVRPQPTGGPRRRTRGPNWRRRLRRSLHSPRARWILIALACLAVLVVGLLAQGFLSSPAPSVGTPDAPVNTSTAVPGASGQTHTTTPPRARDAAAHAGPVSDPLATLRQQVPDNPLNHLRADGVHRVTVSAWSAAPISMVGFLVPTGFGPSYGTAKPHATRWSVSQQAVGPGYLAAIFVQAGADGTPVTCRVTVDGKATNTQSTRGGYGRAVCLG